MKKKHSFKREMEKKQKGLFLMGLMGALSFTLMAFEWTTFDAKYMAQYSEPEAIEIEEIIEVTKMKPKPRIVPPKPLIEEPEIIEKVEDLPEEDPKPTPELDVKQTLDNDLTDLDKVTEVDPGHDPGPEIETGSEIIDLIKLTKVPAYPGGIDQMYKYLGKTIRYTECGKQSGLTGTVYVSFIVEKDGSIADAKVERGLGCGLDGVALKSVEKMPHWSPGEQQGKPVRSRFVLPVRFMLK